MKKFKKILFAFLIIILIGNVLTNGSNDDDTNPEITVKYTGENQNAFAPVDEESIADSMYYPSIEEALKNNGVTKEKGDEYQKNIDEIIKQFESEDYVAIYFRSVKDDNEECFTMAKFKKKVIDGECRYAFLTAEYSVIERHGWYSDTFEILTGSWLRMYDYLPDKGVEPEEKRFLYGYTRFDDVYGLKIEGQEPTEIIPYESCGRNLYFWYYDDLQSDKPGYELEFTVEK